MDKESPAMEMTYCASKCDGYRHGGTAREAALHFARKLNGAPCTILTMRRDCDVGPYGANYSVTYGGRAGRVRGTFALYARPQT
jgi:hypothetical protein